MKARALLLSSVVLLVLSTSEAGLDVAHAQNRKVAVTRPATNPASKPATNPATSPATLPVSFRNERTATQPASAPAEQPGKTIADCHAQYMRGQYSPAAAGFKNLMGQEPMLVAASTGASRALSAEGKYTEALEALAKAKAAAQADFNWHLQYADVLATVGQYEQAIEHAAAANKLQPLNAQTIYVYGRLLETLGRKSEAVKVYNSMTKVIDAEQYRKDAPALVALGQIMDRQSVLVGKKASEQAQNILQNYFQEACKVDPKYWPAHVAAGIFGISKHRPEIAQAEFKLANNLNPRIPDMYVGIGWVLLEGWNFDQCLGNVNQALGYNPNHIDALMLRASCLMQWRKFDEVPAVLDQVLKINPNSIDALSLYAAVHVRKGDAAGAQPYIDRVHKINPTCSDLPMTIASWLSAGRQFDEATKYYQQAIELAPEQSEPLAGLGLLYMQTGDEEKAQETLQKARDLDDFRADVLNYLNLLDKLAKFQVKETEHFIIKVCGEKDAVMLEQIAAEAEKMHAEVCGDFDYQPTQKTIIEFFPTHHDFSVRITGKGWIGTVGASTGRVIVMVVPSPEVERSVFGTYNWNSVLRHEYTHTVTLAKTNNRIPHWFTEACAVWEQPDRRNYKATEQLVFAYRTGGLFSIKELDWGFIRPKKNGDRELAYAQSEWVMEYLIQLRQYQVIIRMLEGFRDGMTQKDVFEKIVGMNEADFDNAFKEWAKTQVQQWGFDPLPPPNLAEASKQAQDSPKDAQALAKLAEALYYARNWPMAEAKANEALAIDPNHKIAMGVLTTILSKNPKKQDEALDMAKRLDAIDGKSRVAPRVIAHVSMEKRQWAQAIDALERLKMRHPLDEYSYEQLATCYVNIGQPEKALPNLIELHIHTMTTPVHARRIADIYRSLDQHEQALVYYNEVTRINPYEIAAHQAMAAIHLKARRYDQSIRSAKNLTLLTPESAESWLTLARVEFYSARQSKDQALLKSAKANADKSNSIESSEQARELISRIEETIKAGE